MKQNSTENNDAKYSFLLKNTAILTISSFSSKILVFLLVPLYTSILSTEEYGAYDISLTTIQLLLPIFTVNIYDAVMRFFMDENYEKKSISAVGLKYITISSILFGVVIFVNYTTGFLSALKEYSLLIYLYYIFNLLNQYLTQMAKGLEKVKIIGIAGVANTFVTIVLNILLLLVARMGLAGFYIAYIAGQGCSALIVFIYTKSWNYLSIKINKQYEREMLAYSIPLILGTIGWWCNNASDRYIVTYMCGIAANGVYSVAYKIPSILTTIQQIFLQAWQISAVKEYKVKDSYEFYGETLHFINSAMCLLCMILIILTKPLARILYAKDFYEAWRYVPFLLISGVFNAASGILGPILNADKNSKSLGVSSLLGAVVNIALNIVLIFGIGVQGAAVATAISSYIIYASRKVAVGNKIVIKEYWKVWFPWLLIVFQAIISIYIGDWRQELLLILIYIFVSIKDILYVAEKALRMKNGKAERGE